MTSSSSLILLTTPATTSTVSAVPPVAPVRRAHLSFSFNPTKSVSCLTCAMPVSPSSSSNSLPRSSRTFNRNLRSSLAKTTTCSKVQRTPLSHICTHMPATVCAPCTMFTSWIWPRSQRALALPHRQELTLRWVDR